MKLEDLSTPRDRQNFINPDGTIGPIEWEVNNICRCCRRVPGPESSIFKMFHSELCQRMYDMGMEAMGPDGAAWYDNRLSEDAYSIPMAMTIARAMSIYSGSNEVQRNIIAKRVLNLPD